MQHKNVGDLVVRDNRTWLITGVYIGAVGQESLVGLEVIDRRMGTCGEDVVVEMLVPEALVEGLVFTQSAQVA